MPEKKPLPATFIIAATALAALCVLYLFGIVPLRNDNFAIFLISLFVAIMLIPMLKHLRFFDLIELRRSYALQKKK